MRERSQRWSIDGHATATPLARQLIAALRTRDLSSPTMRRYSPWASSSAALVWDDDAWVDLPLADCDLTRKLGCHDVLPIAL